MELSRVEMTHDRLPVGISHQIKARLIRQSGRRCGGCGFQFKGHPQALARDQGAMELDHKVPLERNGTNRTENLQVLCLPCHDGKTNPDGICGPARNMTDAEWRAAGKPQDWTRKRRLITSRSSKRIGHIQ